MLVVAQDTHSENRMASYYRARYYDPSTGRFLSEDPAGFEGGINSYAFVGNNPVDLIDPSGLYDTDPQVPKPLPPALDKFMKCMDDCTGTQQYVVATTNGKHSGPAHPAGQAVDLRPVGSPSDKVFCCAGKCGAAFVLDERTIQTPQGTGKHYHIQLVPPRNPSPKYPNAIPNRPECKSGGCSSGSNAGGYDWGSEPSGGGQGYNPIL
jgi:RHS repeat-associated protein